MSAARADTTPDAPTHMRGVRVVAVDTFRVVQVLVVVVLVALLAVAVALAASAASQNSRLDQLQHQGVPVEMTVIGCQAISSGIGMSVDHWECRGTYGLGGHRYNEVIGGSRAHLRDGQSVRAVAVPGHPTLVSTTTNASQNRSTWTPYITPVILTLLSVTGLVGLMLWRKRRPRSNDPTSTVLSSPPAMGT